MGRLSEILALLRDIYSALTAKLGKALLSESNGDIYIIGIGGYDGTNKASASTLQEVLVALGTAADVDVTNALP